jgi:ribulose-5-phosphate 4-epimerase/fuculose-1-phosphate aldolase
MRVPALPVVPYLAPGAPELATETARCAALSPAFLLRNHGSVAIGASLAEAAALAEEVEEAAKLYLLLGSRAQPLAASQVAYLRGRRT